MKRIIKYKAIDPLYSDVTNTYIGSTAEEIDNIQDETEKHMKGLHFSLNSIYKKEWLLDETDPEFNYTIKSFNESNKWLKNYNKSIKLLNKLNKICNEKLH